MVVLVRRSKSHPALQRFAGFPIQGHGSFLPAFAMDMNGARETFLADAAWHFHIQDADSGDLREPEPSLQNEFDDR